MVIAEMECETPQERMNNSKERRKPLKGISFRVRRMK